MITIADLLYQISADCPDQIIKVVFRVCRVFVFGRRDPKAYVVYALGHFANFLNGLKVLNMKLILKMKLVKENYSYLINDFLIVVCCVKLGGEPRILAPE